MRFILQADVYDHLPDDWDERVIAAKKYVEEKVAAAKAKAITEKKTSDQVDAACLKARHSAISAKSSVWRAASGALRSVSHGKCWYCETKQERSDMPVDHFRPKNSVLEDESHTGYTWLAFEWTNFRLSCTYCNSNRRDLEGGTKGGKQDHFPIIPPPDYARSESDPLDRPKLLDPTDDQDPRLLTFLRNGFPDSTTIDRIESERVQASIDLYHLKQFALVRKRKRLAADIAEHVSRGEEAQGSGNRLGFRHHKTELIRRVRAEAELTTAARIYLGAYRDREWIQEILNRDM